MNIFEAVTIAVREDKCITTSESIETVKIKPTNDKGNCIVMGADGSHPSKYGWQPTADDLMREDWVIKE